MDIDFPDVTLCHDKSTIKERFDVLLERSQTSDPSL
jgi:hypothetical protein